MDATLPTLDALAVTPDRYLTCQHCAVRFVWTGWEQQAAADAPGLCPACRFLLALTRRQRGTVKWYDRRKGFGFITTTNGAEVFVHRRSLGHVAALRRGQVVAFRQEAAEHGPLAVEVELLASTDLEPDSPSGA